MDNKVNIIVPVYNSELYLKDCIESIILQTYKDWELVLVDDGSTDSSRYICDQYSTQDCRIKVYHIPNGGVSHARNFGLKNCCSKWICFIDSDDTIDKDYISVLIDGVLNVDNIQLSVCGYRNIYVSSNIIDPHYVNCNGVIEEIDRYIDACEKSNILNSPVCKLFDRDIIISNNILFDEDICYGEDHLFVLSYLQYTRKVNNSSYVGYNYVHRYTNSLTAPWKNTKKYRVYVQKLITRYIELYNKDNSKLLLHSYNQTIHEHIVRALYYLMNSNEVNKFCEFKILHSIYKGLIYVNPQSAFYKCIHTLMQMPELLSFVFVVLFCKIKKILSV